MKSKLAGFRALAHLFKKLFRIFIFKAYSEKIRSSGSSMASLQHFQSIAKWLINYFKVIFHKFNKSRIESNLNSFLRLKSTKTDSLRYNFGEPTFWSLAIQKYKQTSHTSKTFFLRLLSAFPSWTYSQPPRFKTPKVFELWFTVAIPFIFKTALIFCSWLFQVLCSSLIDVIFWSKPSASYSNYLL